MARNNSSGKRTHVVKRENGWAVKKEGAKKATKVYKTQVDAIEGARASSKGSADVVVHRKDGSILKWEKSSGNKRQR